MTSKNQPKARLRSKAGATGWGHLGSGMLPTRVLSPGPQPVPCTNIRCAPTWVGGGRSQPEWARGCLISEQDFPGETPEPSSLAQPEARRSSSRS